MENAIQVFNFNQNEVRIHIDSNNQPWWVAMDVCEVLGLTNPTMAISRLDEDEVTKFNLGGQSGETNIVNEPGLYSLVLASRKKEAKTFKRWITHEVLPQIRKTGSYSNQPQQQDFHPVTAIEWAQAFLEVETQRLLAEARIAKMQPMADYAQNVLDSHARASMHISIFAKSLDAGIGPNQLFAWMRDKKILYKRDGVNVPVQTYINKGYFTLKQDVFPVTDKATGITKEVCKCTTLITVQGQIWLTDLLRKAGYKRNFQLDFTEPNISIVAGGVEA